MPSVKSPVSPVATNAQQAYACLRSLRDTYWTLEAAARAAKNEVDKAEAELEDRRKHWEWVAGKVLRISKAAPADAAAILAEEVYDVALKSKLQKLGGPVATSWATYQKSGATDEQIALKLKAWPSHDGYADGPHVQGGANPMFWIGSAFDRGAAKVKLDAKKVVAAARRLFAIPAPTKPAASSKPSAAKPAASKPFPKTKPTPAVKVATKPAAKPAAGKREQTYAQWLATLRGIIGPSIHKVADPNRERSERTDADLANLFAAKRPPSEAKQILIAAGWFDQLIGQDLTFGSSPKLTARMEAIDLSAARSPKIAKELKSDYGQCLRRRHALARWEGIAVTMKIDMRGAHADSKGDTVAKPVVLPPTADVADDDHEDAAHDRDDRPPARDVPGQMLIKEIADDDAVDEDGYALGFTPESFAGVNCCGSIPRDTPLDTPKAKPTGVKAVQLGDRLYVCLASYAGANGEEGYSFFPLYTPDAFKKRFSSEIRERLGGIEQSVGYGGVHVMTPRGRFVIGPRDERRLIVFNPENANRIPAPPLVGAGAGDAE